MLKLPNIAIISINCIDPVESVKAIRYSCKDIEFKDRFLFTDDKQEHEGIKRIEIPKLTSIDAYSDFCLRVADYKIDADYLLFVQPDGFVLNADKWDPYWLKFGFVGAPWPNRISWIEKQKAKDYMGPWANLVGNGGFSLRSRKFIELSSRFANCEGYNEDNFLCLVKNHFMVDNGIWFPTTHTASNFSMENNLDDWQQPIILDPKKTFGFHGHNFTNSQELINLKNL